MNQAFFITGTGTDVGKTHVCAALIHGLLSLDSPVSYSKPIQTGPFLDKETILQLLTPLWPQIPSHLLSMPPSLWASPWPLSPNQAHRKTPHSPQAPSVAMVQEALATYLPSQAQGQTLIVEGAGGLLVPWNDEGEDWGDMLQALPLPVVLVAQSGLGTLNHTRLTMEALLHRGCTVKGIVLSGPLHPENGADLQKFYPSIPVMALPPWGQSTPSPWTTLCQELVQTLLTPSSPKESWLPWDQAYVWHPYTHLDKDPPPTAVDGAKGPWLITKDQGRLLDTTGSWGVNLCGHGRPEVGQALLAQQRQLDHVIYASTSHEPGARLAKTLVEMTGHHFSKVFYSDNGSSAVEVALKLVYQAQEGSKAGKKAFLAFQGAYHGDTVGAMSVGASTDFFHSFVPLLFDVVFAEGFSIHPSPHCPEGEGLLHERLQSLEQLLSQKSHLLAGVIMEPLVHMVGGLTIQSPLWVEGVVKLCRAHGLPVIFDEVFTGFGRTGTSFAFQQTGVVPDVLCLGKVLSGGTLPLGATLVSPALEAKFQGDRYGKTFCHGHSYTGNPLACTASLVAMDIFQKEGLNEKAKNLEKAYSHWMETTGKPLGIRWPRCLGSVMAFETPWAQLHGGYYQRREPSFRQVALKHGLLIRPLGETVYVCPPLNLTAGELDFLFQGLEKTLLEMTG